MSALVPAQRGRVPVEHRVLGLDRRSFPYAFFVIGVFLVAAVILPRVDDAVSWHDPVLAGQQLAVTSTLVFTPATGWDVESGYRVGNSRQNVGEATVVGQGVTFDVTPGAFNGTPAQLLDQDQTVSSSTGDPSFRLAGAPTTIRTASGEVGVARTFSSVRGDGLVAAFVIDGTGLEITAFGPPAQMAAAGPQIEQMISSITVTTGNGS